MRTTTLIIGLLFSSGLASASDKDVLRDACSSVKPAAKKSECFDALERLTAIPLPPPPPPVAQSPAVLKISMRGLGCEVVEFAEIDSMPRDELEGLYCSYVEGGKTVDLQSEKSLAQLGGDPNMRAAILRSQISESQKCIRGMSKSMDVVQRKFPGSKVDCSKLPVKHRATEG